MRIPLSICFCVVAGVVSAIDLPVSTNHMRRTISPEARSNMLAKTGGMIVQEGKGPSILFLNLQSDVKEDAVRETSELIGKLVRFKTQYQSAKPLKSPVEQLASKVGGDIAAVVAVIEDPELPALLIAPESRWALVNVAPLRKGAGTEQIQMRVQKEIWRAFAMVMGASNSNFETCLLKPVFDLSDLDALKPKTICPEPFNKIFQTGQKLGIHPSRMTTYRRAVQEGWAPAPTNDFQKAVWNEVKSGAALKPAVKK